MFTFRAAGFIATRTSGLSPGVNISRLEKCSWKPLTPASVPAGARISAGKSGRVLRSLPANALSFVKCVPASCMPSPESPANRNDNFVTLFDRLSSARFGDHRRQSLMEQPFPYFPSPTTATRLSGEQHTWSTDSTRVKI